MRYGDQLVAVVTVKMKGGEYLPYNGSCMQRDKKQIKEILLEEQIT